MKKFFTEIITHPLFSGSAVMVFGSNAINVLNYIYHLIMGRLLGPADYGELASLISLIGLLGIIPASIGISVIKYVSSAKNDLEIGNMISWLKTRILQASFIFFVIILVISPLIASFLKIHNVAYFILIAASFLFTLQSGLNRSILQGLLKFKETVISILAENSIKLILSILLVYLGLQVGGAILALVVAALLGWIVTNLYLRYHEVSPPSFTRDIKAMLMFTVPVFIQTIATTSLYSSDVILVKHFFSSQEAGIYAALSTLGKIIFFGAGPIGAVMFPLISQKKTRGQNYRKIFTLSLLTTGLFAAGITAIYYLFPILAIKLLYGSAYLTASNLLVWFGISVSFFTLSFLLISYNLSLGKTFVVVFPLMAAIGQIILIWFFHQSLFMVVLISIFMTALLLISLLIYLCSEKGSLWR